MIPKDIVCTMKITTFMKKNKVLNKFDILWKKIKKIFDNLE